MTTRKQQKDEGHEQAALAKKNFIPSKGDESYLDPKHKSGQYGEQTALSLGQLTQYAHSINKEIESVQKAAAKGQLKIGNYLLKAREFFPGDREFGNWRAENTEIKSTEVATNLMAVARKFSTAPKMIEACSYSALVELVSAPADLIKEIEATVEAGKPAPTREEVRERKSSSPRAAGKTSKSKTIYDKEPERDPEEEALNILQMDLTARLNHKNPYVKVGLYPFGGPPNIEVIEAIDHWYERQEADGTITEGQYDQIMVALLAVRKEYV